MIDNELRLVMSRYLAVSGIISKGRSVSPVHLAISPVKWSRAR
jgi:hypothetical protein